MGRAPAPRPQLAVSVAYCKPTRPALDPRHSRGDLDPQRPGARRPHTPPLAWPNRTSTTIQAAAHCARSQTHRLPCRAETDESQAPRTAPLLAAAAGRTAARSFTWRRSSARRPHRQELDVEQQRAVEVLGARPRDTEIECVRERVCACFYWVGLQEEGGGAWAERWPRRQGPPSRACGG